MTRRIALLVAALVAAAALAAFAAPSGAQTRPFCTNNVDAQRQGFTYCSGWDFRSY